METPQKEAVTYPEVGGYTVVARALSELHRAERPQGYRRQQIHVWWLRRDRNGFPEKHQVELNGRVREIFKVSEVVTWFEGYKLSRGKKHQDHQR